MRIFLLMFFGEQKRAQLQRYRSETYSMVLKSKIVWSETDSSPDWTRGSKSANSRVIPDSLKLLSLHGPMAKHIHPSKGLPTMRYMLRLLSIAFASLIIAPLAFVGETIAVSLRAVSDLFQPSARESLALDRLVEPVAIIPAMRSRFRAFIDSARTHADFTAGHFDPGRMAA